MASHDEQTGAGTSERGTTAKAKDTAKEMKGKAQEKVSHAAAEARDRGEDLVHDGKEKAREAGHRATEMARSRADQQKDRVSEGFRSVAHALRSGGRELSEEHRQYGGFLNTVADKAEGVSRYLDERDVDSLTREARRMARDHTPVLLSGAFTVGMLGARFLKSSGDRGQTSRYEDYDYEGYQTGPAERYEPGMRTSTRRYGSPSGADYGRYPGDRAERGDELGQPGGELAADERSTDLNRSQDTSEGGYA